MVRSRRTYAVVALVVLVSIAGCSGGGNDADGAEPAAAPDTQMDAESTPAATGTPGDGAYQNDDPLAVRDRARIKTGTVELEVGDFHEARRNLTAAVEERNGFVSDTRERLHRVDNETYTSGVIVLRVPAEDFPATMERIREEGTVLESDQDSQDVTEQLVDIEARLENLRAQRDRLRTLYEEANETSDVLEIEERLTEVQTEIERLQARQQSLQRKVALSTIRVELTEPRPGPEALEHGQWYDTGVATAFLESVHGVVVAVRAAVVAFAYVLPYLVVFGVPIGLVGYGIRWWRRR